MDPLWTSERVLTGFLRYFCPRSYLYLFGKGLKNWQSHNGGKGTVAFLVFSLANPAHGGRGVGVILLLRSTERIQNQRIKGTWGAQWVKCVPLTQAINSGSWDRIQTPAPCPVGSLLLLLPAARPARMLSLSPSLPEK